MRLVLTMRTVAAVGLAAGGSTAAADTSGDSAAAPLIMVGSLKSLEPVAAGASASASRCATVSDRAVTGAAGACSVLGPGGCGRTVSGGAALTTLVEVRSPGNSVPA